MIKIDNPKYIGGVDPISNKYPSITLIDIQDTISKCFNKRQEDESIPPNIEINYDDNYFIATIKAESSRISTYLDGCLKLIKEFGLEYCKVRINGRIMTLEEKQKFTNYEKEYN